MVGLLVGALHVTDWPSGACDFKPESMAADHEHDVATFELRSLSSAGSRTGYRARDFNTCSEVAVAPRPSPEVLRTCARFETRGMGGLLGGLGPQSGSGPPLHAISKPIARRPRTTSQADRRR